MVLHEADARELGGAPPQQPRGGDGRGGLMPACAAAQRLVRRAIEASPHYDDVAREWEQRSHTYGIARLYGWLWPAQALD